MFNRGTKRKLGQKGQVIITLAFLLIPLLAVAGLAIDLGRLFVVKAEIAKAVDGAALAGARVLPQGQVMAEQAANSFAGMNFAPGFLGTTGHSFTVGFSPDPTTPRVSVEGEATMPTTLISLVGIDHVTVRAEAEATRRALVLAQTHDTSGSMSNGNAIYYLRSGAISFTNFFDDAMDKMALVRYASGRRVLFPLGYNFKTPMTSAISAYWADGATTPADALGRAAQEIMGDPRPEAYRAMVFFTDGRPTSFRELFRIGHHDVDGVIGGFSDPYRNPDPYYKLFNPNEINRDLSYYSPDYLPDGRLATTWVCLSESRLRTLQAANEARENDIAIFTIGLGNPYAGYWEQPDAALLVEVANVPSAPDPFSGGTIVNGNYNPDQPQGAFYFAPTAAELEEVFDRVAREIAIRLTK